MSLLYSFPVSIIGSYATAKLMLTNGMLSENLAIMLMVSLFLVLLYISEHIHLPQKHHNLTEIEDRPVMIGGSEAFVQGATILLGKSKGEQL